MDFQGPGIRYTADMITSIINKADQHQVDIQWTGCGTKTGSNSNSKRDVPATTGLAAT